MIKIEHLVEEPKVILSPDKVVVPLVMEQPTLSHESSNKKLIKTSVGSGMNKNIILSRAKQIILLGDARQSIEIVKAIITNSIAIQINMRMRDDKGIHTKDSMKTLENKLALKSSYVKCRKIFRGWKKKQNVSMSKRDSIENNTGSNMGPLIMILLIHHSKTGMLSKK